MRERAFVLEAILTSIHIKVPEILEAFQQLNNCHQVILDIIPPEFAMRSTYSYFGQQTYSPRMNLGSHIELEEEDQQSIRLPPLGSIAFAASLPPLSIYQPSTTSYSNSILPSMTMSPTWYSPSTQKKLHAHWMSPSFYYSRPATSVMLSNEDQDNGNNKTTASTLQSIKILLPTRDIVARCLEYRLRKYSPTITPQRMRQVLRKFLKSILLKSNEV